MKVILGALVDAAAGRIGGLVVQKNYHGPMARSYSVPVNNKSTNRSIVNQRFSSFASLWQSLSLTDKSGWVTQALTYSFNDRFGNAYTPTAYQVFQYINGNLAVNGIAPISVAPAYIAVTPPAIFNYAIDLSVNTLSISFSDDLSGNYYYQIFCSGQMPALSRAKKSAMRLVKAGIFQPEILIGLWDEIGTIFGYPANKISSFQLECYLINDSTGIVSPSSIQYLSYEP